MKTIGVIPARYASTRFPGKPLADICGKPMLWWVYQQARKVRELNEVYVATDSEQISAVCEKYNIPFIMTSAEHQTPTDRIAEVATKTDGDIYSIIMGDEPLINSEIIRCTLPQPNNDTELYVAAAVFKMDKLTEVTDTDRQKVVFNANGEILWISRSPIPYPKGTTDFDYYKQSGAFSISKKALQLFSDTLRGELEKAEENDLLRFLENHIKVFARIAQGETRSVDTPKDLEFVRKIIAERNIQKC
jgi:3-deoxy-manno-octulosonate cytidylyltransferase (CMP-KDO synthetase)